MTISADEQRAEQLCEEGRVHMQKGDFGKAIACFREAWQTAPLVAALNNWATVLYYQDEAAQALEVLRQILDDSGPLPYTHALASRCHAALGDRERARVHLNRAIREFDASRPRFATVPGGEQAWVEYTVIIKEAAADLGDHRLVLDLHNRWPGRDLPLGAHAAGVAAFNLGKYAQAARIWERVRDPDWQRPLRAYVRAARLVERGVVPPFELNHGLPDGERLRKLTPEELAAQPVEGGLRLLLLVAMFDAAETEDSGGSDMAAELIRRTGDWGIELGRRLLQGATVPIGLKLGAARALTEAGLFRPGEPIPIIHEGRPTQIFVQEREVAGKPIPELEAIVDQARQLWERGQRAAALKLLTDLHDGPVFYPPAVLLEAHFLREQGQLDSALTLLQTLEELMPDQPAVLFQLAALHLEQGDPAVARHYAEAIDPGGLSPAFRQDLDRLKAMIAEDTLLYDPKALFSAHMESMREQVDEQPISLDVRLATALRRIPVQWLNAAAQGFRVPPQRRRPEREKALAAALQNPDRLQSVLAGEAPEVREALRFLLAEGGWAKLQRLTRRFGGMAGDGFYWDEQPPTSPIGRLRLLGLVYVGRARIGGRNHKVAVVPAELRPLLMPART